MACGCRGERKVETPTKQVANPLFGRVQVINLRRRSDRLKDFVARKLPLRYSVFAAIEGDVVGVPSYYQSGGGAWGCLRSHISILERALMDKLDSVLVLEDDATWDADIADTLSYFMDTVPPDWEMLMLGGQHMSDPTPVSDGVVRVHRAGRTHAYAMRPKMMRAVLEKWYAANVHCDWVLEDLHQHHIVYAPDPFLFGQAAGRSDISGNRDPARYWKPPTSRHCIHLTASREVADALQKLGWHRGFWVDSQGLDMGLNEAVKSKYPLDGVKKWFDAVNWEAASSTDWVPCCWHPSVTVEDLKKICDKVSVIKAETVEEALEQYRQDI